MLRQHEDLMQALVAAQVALLDHASADSDADEDSEWLALNAALNECVVRFRALDRRMRELG